MSVSELLRHTLESWPGLRLAVLFGSAARGGMRRDSDVDLGILLEDGSDPPPSLAVALARAAGREVEVIGLESAPPLLRFEIARDGQPLVERMPGAWTDFKARAMVDWWDWAPTARLMGQSAIARLRAEVAAGPR